MASESPLDPSGQAPGTSGSVDQDGAPVVRGRLLDGFLLLASGGPSFMLPDEAVRANLSSLDIVEVSDDLRFFHNLDSLDLSDNFLNYSGVLEHIFVTPRLSTLNLSCNQLATLTCNPNPMHYPSAFHSLTHLDLSFNELHGDILMALAPLPKLEKLNLTANCVSSIPPEEAMVGFASLQELILDSNDLVQLDQWRSLDCLPKLRVLGLAANRIRRLKGEPFPSQQEEVPGRQGSGSNGERPFFAYLEQIDLRGNDFTSLDALSLLYEFQNLRKVLLSVEVSQQERNRSRFEIETQKPEAFYMTGNGSHTAHKKKKKNVTRRPFRKVDGSRPDWLPTLRQSMGKVHTMDDEQLQRALMNEAKEEEMMRREESLDQLEYKLPALDLVEKNYSDEDMNYIFKRRREKIDALVAEKVAQEPQQAFLKPIPFALSDQMVRIIKDNASNDQQEVGKVFLTQAEAGDVDTYFSRFTERELVTTPRTPPEVKQQKLALQKKQVASGAAAQSGIPAVDVPIDVKRSLAALRDAMDNGGDVF